MAGEFGVSIALENVWNNFLLSPLELARYIDEFEDPNIGSYFDVGNVVRFADGVFRIASVCEVRGVVRDGFDIQEVFRFRGTSEDGGFAAAGVIPEFYAKLEARGLPADTSIFRT